MIFERIKIKLGLTFLFQDDSKHKTCGMPGKQWIGIIHLFVEGITGFKDFLFLAGGQVV